MKHLLLLLGKTRENFIAEGVAEYAARLQHYTDFAVVTLKEKGRGRGGGSGREGEQLLQAVPPGAFLVVLDPRGRQFSSEAFATEISGWEQRGLRQICYLIGGPEGHGANVVAAADLLLSLSPMTFTHDMSRLLLVEQLYRGYTIKAGEQYHK
jgi:23S rRNA (pseudouridine1915-N3)-methyltransferase